jgi:hypothetical protein
MSEDEAATLRPESLDAVLAAAILPKAAESAAST